MPDICIVLPPREQFSAAAAGAIAMVVRRLAGDAMVLGTPCAAPFADVRFQGVANFFALAGALRRLRPKFIDVHQQPRLALCLSVLFPAARVMLFLHNDPLTMRGLKSRFGRRLLLRRLHRVVCVSAYLAGRYMDGIAGAAPAVLANPLDLAALPPRPPRRENLILFAGRITTDKAPDVFIAACAQALPALPGWTARMIGGDRFGPASPETGYVARMRAAAAQAGVAFAGFLPHAQVLAAMAAVAIVVVPSRWAEPFGLTALEALASGAALITTRQGGLPEVAGAAAVYVPPDEPGALAAAILALARDAAGRQALAAAGLAQARKFDTKVIAAALAKLRATV